MQPFARAIEQRADQGGKNRVRSNGDKKRECGAAACLAEQDPDTPVAVALAKADCSDTAVLAGQEMIQLHGGIGFTWEHPAHVYLRRATVGRRLLADPQALLEDLAQVIEDTVFVSTAVPAP